MSTDQGLPPYRDKPVGAALADLRRARGLSGADLAAMVGMSQPKISRIERGRGSVDPRDVEAIARALGAADDAVADLVERTIRAQNRIVDWRPASDDLYSRQDVVAATESTTGVVRELAAALLPGLLQTSGYAKSVIVTLESLRHAGHRPVTEQAILRAVATRISRQEYLANPSRRLHAVIAEVALRGGMCTPAVMLAQISHLREAARRPNVTIEIIPEGTRTGVPVMHGFAIYDDDLLVIDIYNTGLVSRGEKDIADYRRVFDAVAAHATADIDPILDRHELRCLDEIRRPAS